MDQQSPLKKTQFAVYFLFIIIVIICCILWINPNSFFTNGSFFHNLLFSILSALIALFAAIFYVNHSFIHLQRAEYDNALYALKKEIRDNYQEFKKFPEEIDRVKKLWDEGKVGWSSKRDSFTNWGSDKYGNFYLKYLPSNAYYNFINKGYILNTEYCEIHKMNLSYFYECCMQFSTELQQIEREINQFIKNNSNLENQNVLQNYIEAKTRYLKCEFYNAYRDKSPLNNGIEFSYQEVMKSLNNCEKSWITCNKESLIKKLCFYPEREKEK